MSNYLNDVPGDKMFWVSDGSVLKGLKDLSKKLKEISKDDFVHHVNKERNDFFNWIKDVIGDIKLANSIRKIDSSTKMQKVVENRIRELQN